MKLFSFRNLLVSFSVLFFLFGGYVGYLSALVDQDELIFLQRVDAVSDKDRLEKQLARAKSILDARRRAYLRRAETFYNSLENEEDEEAVTFSTTGQAQQSLDQFWTDSRLEQNERVLLTALQEEREDVAFFEDEVETLEQLLAREFPEEELSIVASGDRSRRRVSDALRRLFELLDKQKELNEQRQVALESFSYWERYPQPKPDGVDVTVFNKGSGQKELQDVHVTQISTALAIMPQDFDGRLERLYIVYGDPEMRRGMSGVGVVFMKGEELDFFRVLVHEFGHIYDLHREVTQGEKSEFYDGQYRLFIQDPSVQYYQFSWENNYERKAELSAFASSYGSTDPFEDFAEAYALYVLQGKTFRQWADEDPVMALKYDFLNQVFYGRTFVSQQDYLSRPYDVTMLSVDYDQLLKIDG